MLDFFFLRDVYKVGACAGHYHHKASPHPSMLLDEIH